MAAASSTKDIVPGLRPDLKVSRQVMSEKVSFVIKDPIKNQYFRFEESEWGIISLFDGKRSLETIQADYNQSHDSEIDLDTLKDYRKNLESMNLLVKSKKEMNVMLVEKMGEMRKSQLLSKKGSIMYKRFPLVDPDKFFNKIIPHIQFFWTRGFFILSMSCILLFALIVMFRWSEFHNGVFEVFQFSQMSFWNLAFLWITIYAIIAIHELGHGLTCKFYGGEVHEIGFLLLFFQPCLYANVNDAWLFDRKWKQIMVTVAGGYIEFWVGSLFAIVWAVSSTGTTLNVLSLQVMTICSVSTIICNFNPLIKLDGYYLLADLVEVPNLRDGSFDYLKYLSSKYLFRMQVPVSEATNREKIIFLTYGVLSFFWVAGSTLGLFALAKGFLIDRAHEIGVIVSLWVAYKLFGGHVMKSKEFVVKWAIAKSGFLRSSPGKKWMVGVVTGLLIFVLLPISYSISGSCTLDAASTQIIRANTQGIIEKFWKSDGALIQPGDAIAQLKSSTLGFDFRITEVAVEKLEIKRKASLRDNSPSQAGTERELAAKKSELEKVSRHLDDLTIRFESDRKGLSMLSCDKQIQRINTMVKEGDELCRVHSMDELQALVEIPEHQVRFMDLGNKVEFRLHSSPFETYEGRIGHIRSLSKKDPLNPKAKLYIAEIFIKNPGDLRLGMTGTAKIVSEKIAIGHYIGRKLAGFFRMDLFF